MSASYQIMLRTDPRPRRSGGFTLVEILVVIGIVAVLVSLVLPMLRSTIASARGFRCQMSLRSISYDFAVFADDVLHGPRGDDATDRLFSLASFQDSLYGVDEFWAWGQDPHTLPDLNGNDPMRCSEVRGPLTVRANAPCDAGGVGPYQNVSFGLNIRLHVQEVVTPAPAARPLRLTSMILDRANANVPLVWDVDGAGAVAADTTPFYSGPSLNSPAVFAGSQYWWPGTRHNRAINIGFVDGHVDASRTPLQESRWDWGFVPGR